jgi:hypothetical protein
MTVLTAVLVTIFLACCFACLGDILIQRRSAGLLEWNQSFLVGLSLAGTILFPLSWLFRGGALLLVAACLVGACAARLLRPLQWPRSDEVHSVRPLRSEPVSVALIILIAVLAIQFNVQNLRLTYVWDGYQVWATRALILYHGGALGKVWLSPGYDQRLLAYPPMVPLYEALVSLLRGGFEWNALKPVFGFFYVSMLISTFQAAANLVSRPVALGATALLACLPAVSTGSSIGGYADMPQAALAAGVIAAILGLRSTSRIGWRSPVPWLVGGLIAVKSEGTILALIVCAILILWKLTAAPDNLRADFRRYWQAMTVVLGCLALRWLYVAWLQFDDSTYGPLDRAHFLRAWQNLLLVVTNCSARMLDVAEWGVFWPAFFMSALLLAIAGTRRERLLVAGTLAAVLAYTSTFCFTNWDIALQIHDAYNRLLAQLAPPAAISIAAAWAHIRGVAPDRSQSV